MISWQYKQENAQGLWADMAGKYIVVNAPLTIILAREYGWQHYKAIFRKYEEAKPTLQSNQEKMDYWIHNLIPLFKFWDFPVSQSTIDALAGLEIPPIKDEPIQLAPEHYAISI